MSKKISIVIPVFNEALSLDSLVQELLSIANTEFQWEFIFVDDGSSDESLKKIEDFIARDVRGICISLTRNFGKEFAVAAGIDHAIGDAVIVIDGDLQHPPSAIPEFLKKWSEGFLVVNGVRKVRQHDGYIRKIGARIFYWLMESLSPGRKILNESTDFRLLDRVVVNEFLKLREHRRLNRALVDWLGFRCADVEFVVADRVSGVARYSYRKLIATAVGALVSNSQVPLSLAGYLGCAITFFSGLLGVFIIIEQIILNDPLKINASASAMMAVFMLFLNGIVLMCLGLISLYIGSIHEEVLSRPLYVVGRKINFVEGVLQKNEKQETS